MSFLASLASVVAQPGVQVVAAGLLSGALGGTALVVSGALPIAGTQTPPETLSVLACPGTGPTVGEIADGQRVLAVARSADGAWVQLYIGFPGVERGWAPADALNLDTAADALPVSACEAPTDGPAPTAGATVDIPTASPEPTPTTSDAPSLEPSAAPSPSASLGPSPSPGASASSTIRPSASPSKKPSTPPSLPPTAPPATSTPTTPPITPTPDNVKPTLTGLNANPTCVDAGGSPTATISVQATDNVGVLSVSIGIAAPGGASFVASMTHGTGNTWFYVLYNNANWAEGHVNYTVTAQDLSGNVSNPAYNDPFSPSNWVYHSTSSCSIG